MQRYGRPRIRNLSASAAVFAVALGVAVVSCGKDASRGGQAGPATLTSAESGPAPDAHAISAATGGTPETSGNVVKVSFPRIDVPIQIDTFKDVPPFMGLTSYASFMPVENGGVMMMGDLVLFEDEVNPAMSAALDNGLEVTALHNHFFFDKPRVFFMHVAGMGSIEQVGAGVKATLEAAKAVRRAAPAPREAFGERSVPSPSSIDAEKLERALGIKGNAHDGMYKATFGRTVSSTMCAGCWVGSAMGINTWAAFAGTDEDAVVDGDFAVTEDELQGVLKTLRRGGIDIVAIHSHTMGESPRILFLHYWGRGAATDLAKTVKSAVQRTAWESRFAPTPP